MTKIDSFEVLSLDSLPTFDRLPPSARREAPWTDAEVAELKKLWAKGLSAGQCAKHLPGYSRNAVIGKIHRLGLAGLSGRAVAAKRNPRQPAPERGKRPPATSARPRTTVPRSAPPVETAEPLPICREVEIPIGQRKRLVDLEACDCRWPIGDPQSADFHFCGYQKLHGSPYCEMHSQRAFQPERVAPKRPSFEVRIPGGKVIAR